MTGLLPAATSSDVAADAVGVVWAIVAIPLLLTLAAGGALLFTRRRAREERTSTRLWLLPFRADE